MDKEKRKTLKESAVADRERRVASLKEKIAKKRGFYEAEILADEAEIERLMLEIEAFKGLKNA